MTIGSDQLYAGKRILEAMKSGVRYGNAIFDEVCNALPPDARAILDFGAGAGIFADKFRSKGIPVDVVEQDPQLTTLLEPLAGQIWTDIRSVPSEAFDFIYTINVLEHIAGLDAVCTELLRVLKPSGRIFVFVPAYNILWTSLDDEIEHVRRFDRRSLRLALEVAGFRLERMTHFDLLGFPAALGVRLLESVNLFQYGSGSVGFYDRFLFPVSRGLDWISRGAIGKNLIAIAERPN